MNLSIGAESLKIFLLAKKIKNTTKKFKLFCIRIISLHVLEKNPLLSFDARLFLSRRANIKSL